MVRLALHTLVSSAEATRTAEMLVRQIVRFGALISEGKRYIVCHLNVPGLQF